MMNMDLGMCHNKLFVLLLVSLHLTSCGRPEKIEENFDWKDELVNSMPGVKGSEKNLNLLLLLDLSDGMTAKYPGGAMEYHEMDCGYISSIVDAFTMHLLTKKLRKTNDQIRIFIEPVPPKPEVTALLNKLKYFSFSKKNATEEKYRDMREKFKDNSKAIYDLAIKEDDFPGSDLWSFFDTKLEDYLAQDTSKRNLLFVLTDGYPYHKSNRREQGHMRNYVLHKTIKEDGLDNNPDWQSRMNNKGYKILPTSQRNLDNLEVCVIGLRPMKGAENNPYEIDILKKFWTDWLLDMGIKEENILVKASRLPVEHESIIRQFIGLKQ
jgi:hypothetical protein